MGENWLVATRDRVNSNLLEFYQGGTEWVMYHSQARCHGRLADALAVCEYLHGEEIHAFPIRYDDAIRANKAGIMAM